MKLKSEVLFEEMDVFYDDLPKSAQQKMDKIEELLNSTDDDDSADAELERLDNELYNELQALNKNPSADALPSVDNRTSDSKAELDNDDVSPYFWL